MHDNKLEVPYECESDEDEDGDVNNTINDEFEGVLTQVREGGRLQESALKRGNKRSAGNMVRTLMIVEMMMLMVMMAVKMMMNDGGYDDDHNDYHNG